MPEYVYLAEVSGGEYSGAWQAIIGVYSTAELAKAACLAYIRAYLVKAPQDRDWDDSFQEDVGVPLASTLEAPQWQDWGLDERGPSSLTVPSTYFGPARYTVNRYVVEETLDEAQIVTQARGH